MTSREVNAAILKLCLDVQEETGVGTVPMDLWDECSFYELGDVPRRSGDDRLLAVPRDGSEPYVYDGLRWTQLKHLRKGKP